MGIGTLLDEEEMKNADLNGTAAETLDTARDAASDAAERQTEEPAKAETPGQTTPSPSAPTYGDDEMLAKITPWNADYTQEELDAMTDEQYARYKVIADEYYKKNPTPEMRRSANDDAAKKHKDMLLLSDELAKKADFIVQNTDEDDDDEKGVHAEMAKVRDFLTTHTAKDLTPEELDVLKNDVNAKYDTANKNRGHAKVAWDALKKGYWSVGNMIYQGGKTMSPWELDDEDRQLFDASMQNDRDLEIAAPQKIGGVENVHSVGDALDWFLEVGGENVPRSVVALGATTLGAVAGGPVGAVLVGTLGTMAMNTGEAVQDQINEKRNGGDVTKSRGWTLAQGFGYSLLDGAFGVSRWGAKLFAGALKKAGAKKLAESIVRPAVLREAEETAKMATVKGAVKETLKHGVLGEGLQEVAQSQGVGRAVRLAQTGSLFKLHEDGMYETPKEAWWEAVNEFAGGAAAGLTFGLVGGASSHVNAARKVEAYDKIDFALKDDKNYNQLDAYTKLLVKNHLVNDSYLGTTNLITPGMRAALNKCNADIDKEIDRLSNLQGDKNADKRLVGQSARLYLDTFKSQYALENLNDVVGEYDESTGEYKCHDGSSFKPNVDVDGMRNSGRIAEDDAGNKAIVYENPVEGSKVSVMQFLGPDGKPNGKYSFNNDPSRKMPLFSVKTDENGNRKTELECGSIEEALEKARRIDVFNQWRAKKMESKIGVAKQVFDHLFGGRGVNLRFVDRPSDGTASVATTRGGFGFDERTGEKYVELSLDNIDNLGELYTALVHERTHADIVDFLLKSGSFTKTVGAKQTIDWDRLKQARDEMFAKAVDTSVRTKADVVNYLVKSNAFAVNRNGVWTTDMDAVAKKAEELYPQVVEAGGISAEMVSGLYRKEGARANEKGRYGKDDVTTAWGRSAGEAGEEMIAERNSVIDMARQLRNADRGIIGGVLEKVRSAIGMKMAMDLGVDPRAITAKDVATEVDALAKLGYIYDVNYGGEKAPTGFERQHDDKQNYEDENGFEAEFDDMEAHVHRKGYKLAGPTVNGNEEVNAGEENVEAGKPNLLPQLERGQGATFENHSVVRRADGQTFIKMENENGTWKWWNRDTNEEVDDDAATEGGYKIVAGKNTAEEAAPTEEEMTTPAPAPAPTATAPAPETAAKPAADTTKTPTEPSPKPKTAKKAQKTPLPEAAATETKNEPSEAPSAPGAVPAPSEEGVEIAAAESPKAGTPKAEEPAKTVAAEPKKTEPASTSEAKPTKVDSPKQKAEAKPLQNETVSAATPKADEQSPVKVSPSETVTVPQGTASPVSVDAKSEKVSVKTEPKTMSAATKKKVLTYNGVSAKVFKPEVEKRWLALDEMEDGAVVNIGGTKFRKIPNESGTADRTWERLGNKPTKATQLSLARLGDHERVVETPKAEEPSLKELVKQSVERNKAAEAVLPKLEMAKRERKAEPELTEDEERVKDETEYVLAEKYTFANDAQKETIKKLAMQYGQVPELKKSREGNLVGFLLNGKPKAIINEDGSIFDGKKKQADDKRHSTVFLNFPEIPKGMTFGEVFMKKLGAKTMTAGLASDKLYRKAFVESDYPSFMALWHEWTDKPEGTIRKWFSDHGATEEEMPRMLEDSWHVLVKIREESFNLEHMRSEALKVKKEFDETAKKLGLPPLDVPEGTPLGRTVPPEVVAKSVAGHVWNKELVKRDEAKKTAGREKDKAEHAKKAAEEARAKALAKREEEAENATTDEFNAMLNGSSVEEERAKRERLESGVIPEEYLKPAEGESEADFDKRICMACVDREGVPHNPLARQAVIAKVAEIMSRDSVVSKLNGTYRLGNSLVGEAYDYVRDTIAREWENVDWSNPDKDKLWKGTGDKDNLLVKHVMSIVGKYGEKQLKDLKENTSYDLMLAKAGKAAEAEIARAAAWRDDDVEGDDFGEIEGDGRESDVPDFLKPESDDEIRKKKGYYDSAVQAAREILGSGILTERQHDLLVSLMDAWSDMREIKRGEYKRELLAVEHGKDNRTLNKLEPKWKAAKRLDFKWRDVTDLAAKRMRMAPNVFRAEVDMLLRNIAIGLGGKKATPDVEAANEERSLAEREYGDKAFAVQSMAKKVGAAEKDAAKAALMLKRFGALKGSKSLAARMKLLGERISGRADEHPLKTLNALNRFFAAAIEKAEAIGNLDKAKVAALREMHFKARMTTYNKRLAKGMFGEPEVYGDLRPWMKNAYDLMKEAEKGELERMCDAMEYEGDIAMLKCVLMAEKGKTDAEIRNFAEKGGLDNLANRDGAKQPATLLKRAYKNYGWIDPRVSKTDAALAKEQKRRIVEKLMVKYLDGVDVASLPAIEIARRTSFVKPWFDFKDASIDDQERVDIVRGIAEKWSGEAKRSAQARQAEKKNNHDIVAKMMAENGNDEKKVAKLLAEAKYPPSMVKRMIADFNALDEGVAKSDHAKVESAIGKFGSIANAIAAMRHAKVVDKLMRDNDGNAQIVRSKLEKEVTKKPDEWLADRDAVNAIFGEDFDVRTVLSHHKSEDKRLAKERAAAAKEAEKAAREEAARKSAEWKPPEKSAEEKAKEEMLKKSVQDKRALLGEYAAENPDATNEDLVSYGTNVLYMDELTAQIATEQIRPPKPTVLTDEEIAERRKNAPDYGISEADEERYGKKIDAEIEEMKKEEAEKAEKAKKLSAKEKADADKFQELFAKLGKKGAVQELRGKADRDSAAYKSAVEADMAINGSTEEEARAKADELMRKGYSKNRIVEMIEAWEKVYGGDADGVRNSTKNKAPITVIEFAVNYGGNGNENVTSGGRTMQEIISHALHYASGPYHLKYHDVELTPLDSNGREITKYGKITSHDLNDPRRLRALESAFGIESDEGNARISAGRREHAVPKKSAGVQIEADSGNGRGQNLRNADGLRGVRRESVKVEPEDPEEASLVRSGKNPNNYLTYSERFSTKMAANDRNAVFAAEESQLANKFRSRKVKGRAHKTNEKLREEAEALRKDGEAKFRKVVEKGIAGEILTDVEVAAILLDQADRYKAATDGSLTSEIAEANWKNIKDESKALKMGLSEAAAALAAAKFGIDLRTMDTASYIKAQLRAKLEREADKQYGMNGAVDHAAEIEAELAKKDGEIKKMADEMAKLHDKIDEQRKIIEEKEKKAGDKTIDQMAKDARREGFKEGVAKGRAIEREEEAARRADAAKILVGKYGFSESDAEEVAVASDRIEDVFGFGKRFAGNPKISLTDEQRNLLGFIVYKFGDEAKARGFLVDKYGEQIAPFFDQFVEEQNKKAVSPDGSMEGKRNARKRNIKKLAEEAKVEKTADEKSEEVDVGDLFGEGKEPAKIRVKNEKGKKYVDRIKKKVIAAEMEANAATGEKEKLAAIGEYARNLFKLLAIARGDGSGTKVVGELVDNMNEVYGSPEFDEDDARHALIGHGDFAPVNKKNAEVKLAQLKKAHGFLLKNPGKVAEAAAMAGVPYASDAEMLLELDRRIGRMIDKRLNTLESRANEEPDEKLGGEIRDLIVALHDLRSGKPTGELLDKYLNLAVGMKDYRRQRSLIERIESRIDVYERKIANNDFEPKPARVVPDTLKEIKTIKHLEMDLERLRERFKHSRDEWKLKKEPWVPRQVGSIMEILGELKAIAGSMDLSSVLRQGGQMTWAHPILAAKNLKRTLAVVSSEEKANEEFDKIWDRPNAKFYHLAGIEFTMWGDNSGSAEDLYLLNQYRKITNKKFIKAGVEMSERAFTTYLNLMRADVFDAIVANSPFVKAENMTAEQLKAVGNYVNVASQRGMIDASGKLGKALNAMNAVLWSPRNLVSRFQFIVNTGSLLLPGTKFYGTTDWTVRKMLVKETGRYVLGVGCAIAFAKLMADLLRGDDEPPEDVVFNLSSSQFLEVKIGDTHLDFLSGLKQFIVFGTRFVTGEKVNARGQVQKINRPETVGNFLRSKFAPASGIVYDVASGENYDKQDILWAAPFAENKDEIGIVRYAFDQTMPLTSSDVIDQFKANGPAKSFLTVLFAVLGAGANTYDARTYKQLASDFRYFKKVWMEADDDSVRRELELKHPMLRNMGAVDERIKYVSQIKSRIKKMEKAGIPTKEMTDLLERAQKQAMNLMIGFKHPMTVDPQ